MFGEQAPEGINTYEGRLATFKAIRHLPKRRASSTRKRTPATAEWPHSIPRGEDMAFAGFYYDPSPESLDNVKCFHCGNMMDGWEEDDDPVTEHVKHAPSCGFAITVASSRRKDGDIFDAQADEDPLGENLVNARLATFSAHWPHENRKGWRCKTKKMVEAGFCFEPSNEDEDNVKCYYCNLVLGGWEPKDDPSAEHARRMPDCNFFLLCKKFQLQHKAPRTQKGRTSRVSKASSLSTQSNMTTFSEAPSMMSLGDGPAEEDDSVITTATTATATSTAPKGKRKGRTTAATRKPSRSRKAKEQPVEEPQLEGQRVAEEMQVDSSIVSIEPPPPPPKRARRVASRTQPSQLDQPTEESQPLRKTSKSVKPRGKAKAKQRLSDDESQLHSELQAAIDQSVAARDETPKPARGVKRTSDGGAKLDSSIVSIAQPPEELKPPKIRQSKKQTVTTIDPEPPFESHQPVVDASLQKTAIEAPPKKPGAKAKKGKKAASQTAAQPEQEPDIAASRTHDSPKTEREVETGKLSGSETPVPSQVEPSPAPSTPTPARHPTAAAKNARFPAKSAAATAPKAATPTSSPQSSDAENKPPSSKPSASRPPLATLDHQVFRVPLAASTPNASPSRGANLVTITSTIPWSPTDVENVFLASPVKAAYLAAAPGSAAPDSSDSDKENANALARLSVEKAATSKAELKALVQQVKKAMSTEERAMTVEEWIRWNARRQADRLRSECEALVMVFEREGGRAMRVLEGIDAV